MAPKVFEQAKTHLGKYRSYRDLISKPNVKPITYTEWLLGRISGRLLVKATDMAYKRGDLDSLKAAVLTTWAGNQNAKRNLLPDATPAEVSKAIKENRIHVFIDEPEEEEQK